MIPFRYCLTGLLVLLSCVCKTAEGQVTDSTAPVQGFVQRLQQFGKEETISSIQKYKDGKTAMHQEDLLQELRYTSEQARVFLRKGFDTAGNRKVLSQIHRHLLIASDGIITNQNAGLTTRSLAVSSAVLQELLQKATDQRNGISRYGKTASGFIDRIDSLSADSSLYLFPSDSLQLVYYFRKVRVAARELGPVDTALRQSAVSLQQLQTDMDLLIFDIRSRIEEVAALQKEQTARIFEKEFAYLWEQPPVHRPISDVVEYSVAKERLALYYYLPDYKGRLIILLLLLLASWYFLRSLKEKWVSEKELDPRFQGQLVVRYPLLSATIIVISIFQFLFLQPPFIFNFCLWLIMAICLAILFYGFVSAFWLQFWLLMELLFILAGITNMTLQVSRTEQWWMLLLSMTGVIYGSFILRSKHRRELKEKGVLYFVVFLIIMQALSLFFNVAGRYNLAKTLLVSGYTGLIIAILFLWTVRLINEGLRLIAAVYKHPDRKLFYIDFNRIGEKVPGFFYVFLVAGWFILVARNFYAFQQIITPFTEFLTAERTVGNYTFTINSLFIFVLIVSISAILSQVISFFAGEPGDQRDKDKRTRRPGIGSWLLLIRIFILTVGLFFAFAAAGIPIDKLAFALGALGVGIGLGLQGLVSNLVSGLIIAFEKPVNVGDIIEVNGRSGTMKSIGFRSSVVSLNDGPCLIIPNGDLLSHHLVNWTMGNNKRQLNVVISVAYGTDLRHAKSILENILKTHEKILQYPEPVVSVKALGDSAVSFDLYWWIGHVRDFLQLRSEVITRVTEAFLREGIVIPFPQYDLHIIGDKPGQDQAAGGSGQ